MYQLPRRKFELLPDERPMILRLMDAMLPVIRDPRAAIIMLEDPFDEEIRLRVRWGWQDATAREGLPSGMAR